MNNWYAYKVQADRYAADRRREAAAHRLARARRQSRHADHRAQAGARRSITNRVRARLTSLRAASAPLRVIGPGHPVPSGHGTPAP